VGAGTAGEERERERERERPPRMVRPCFCVLSSSLLDGRESPILVMFRFSPVDRFMNKK
jgi:hypothetical protein